MRHHKKSEQLIERAQRSIPGGVNSPVRAFKGVGGTPVFFESASGATLIDVDGHTYIDFVGAWGPMILGHGHTRVRAAIAARTLLCPWPRIIGPQAPTKSI